MIGTGVQVRIDVSFEAPQVIHMMQKFNRVDHVAITHPVLSPVRELCATTLDLVNFVVRTARISIYVDREAQCREVLDVLEKRSLKMPFNKREPSDFRSMVQTYYFARRSMLLDPTSSPDTFRRLEWYLSNTIHSNEQQMKLDKMARRPLYFKLMTANSTSDRQLHLVNTALDSTPVLDGVARFVLSVECVVYGGTSAADVARVRNLILDLADRTGIKFDEQRSQSCTPISVHVGQFVFSAAGALRHAAAA